MDDGLDLHGLFEHNTTYDYNDYEYKEDCVTVRSFVVVSVLYSVALVLGLIGNALVLAVLWKKSCRWSVTDAFVLHLSVADLLLLLTMPLQAVDAVKGWSFSNGICKLTGALFKINFLCGIFLLTCICMHLYLSAFHTVRICSHTQAQLICLTVWIFCLVLSIPDWMYLTASNGEKGTTECAYEYPSRPSRLVSVLCYHVLGFLLPVIVLLYCFTRLLLQCRSDQRVQKQRAVQVILALVLTFLVSWTPYSIALLVDTYILPPRKPAESCDVQSWTALKITAVLGLLHTCFNPLIYLSFSKKFRHRVLTILKCGGCTVDSGGFFSWDSREIDRATSVPQEENGSLHQMSDIKKCTTQQSNELL